MKISLFLMIILTFFKSYKAEEDYPIEIFLNLIQNTEIYNIINAIKYMIVCILYNYEYSYFLLFRS